MGELLIICGTTFPVCKVGIIIIATYLSRILAQTHFVKCSDLFGKKLLYRYEGRRPLFMILQNFESKSEKWLHLFSLNLPGPFMHISSSSHSANVDIFTYIYVINDSEISNVA